MKMKKLLTVVLALTLAFCTFAFAGCLNSGDDSTGGDTDKTTLRMEAEYVNLDGVKGAGISSDQQGVNMIYGNGEKDASKWSEGYFVYCTYAPDVALEFKFNAKEAASGSITMMLGSEHGEITFGPTILKAELNGVEITYTAKKVKGYQVDDMKFTEVKITTSAALKAGENVFKLTVIENKLQANKKTVGPCIDYVQVKSTTELSWTPKTENPSQRGAM